MKDATAVIIAPVAAGLAVGAIFIVIMSISINPLSFSSRGRLSLDDEKLAAHKAEELPEVRLFLTKYPFASIEVLWNDFSIFDRYGNYAGLARSHSVVYDGVKRARFDDSPAAGEPIMTYHSLSLAVHMDEHYNIDDVRLRCSTSHSPDDKAGSVVVHELSDREKIMLALRENQCFRGE
jgi:hypothetical protein